MDLKLNGKSVIVTGGASNIGRAIVLGLAREGSRITLADIDAEQAENVADEAQDLGATDITDLKQVKAMVAAAEDRYGRIDLVKNDSRRKGGAIHGFEETSHNISFPSIN